MKWQAPAVSDTVLDMCCGMGNFFNHLPNEYNAYGFDIDENAVKVAKRLYPDANITVDDMHFYDPKMKFDVIFGNPPYNLTIEDVKSQHFFTHKAYWLLNPGGLMMLVMPSSYLQSASADRMYINMMNRDFRLHRANTSRPQYIQPHGRNGLRNKDNGIHRQVRTHGADTL
ncbi:class I SAM-dependent methyltransferase [Bacteroides salyersiae]|nr:class I SAM-dependent methyltransferase [Bacteroides salyersiae]